MVDDDGCAAAVLLYDPERRVALVLRQLRASVIAMGAADLLEVVAGRLDGKSEDATVGAEAMEEASSCGSSPCWKVVEAVRPEKPSL